MYENEKQTSQDFHYERVKTIKRLFELGYTEDEIKTILGLNLRVEYDEHPARRTHGDTKWRLHRDYYFGPSIEDMW